MKTKIINLVFTIMINTVALSAMQVNDPFFDGKGLSTLRHEYCTLHNQPRFVDLVEVKKDVMGGGGHSHWDNKSIRIRAALEDYLDDVLSIATNGNRQLGGVALTNGAVVNNGVTHNTAITNPNAISRNAFKTALLNSIFSMTLADEIVANVNCRATALPLATSPLFHYIRIKNAIQDAFINRITVVISQYMGGGGNLANNLLAANNTRGLKCGGQNTAILNRHTGAALASPAGRTAQNFIDALHAVVISVGD